MSAVSTEQFVLSLTGILPYVYEQAWQSVLGTRFRLEVVDWRATRTAVQDARLAERLARESAGGLRGREPSDGLPPGRPAGMRATLIRRDERTWTFAWRYDRALMDRRAGLRTVDRAAEAYRTLLRGGDPRRAAAVRRRLAGPVGR
ncbi:hypothetical protein ACIGO8_32835 [Streptomyces sp. NPDC053493]|uniref:hypothetical protein n=1 Tax=Streptomyces sp. NPDC053493 TaxID=3365705 RepID=UPI0037D1978D